jgi:hypothetical protein
MGSRAAGTGLGIRWPGPVSPVSVRRNSEEGWSAGRCTGDGTDPSMSLIFWIDMDVRTFLSEVERSVFCMETSTVIEAPESVAAGDRCPKISCPTAVNEWLAADPVTRGLEVIGVVLDVVNGAGREAADDEERLGWIEASRVLARRASALHAVLCAEADAAGSSMRARGTPMATWLARSGQETPNRASAGLWDGRALEGRPEVAQAARDGRIGMDHVRAISAVLTSMPATLTLEQREAAEGLLVSRARDHTAEELSRMGDRMLADVAPQQVDTLEAREEALRARDPWARARRSLRFEREVDGSIAFRGCLPVLEASRIQALVQRAADLSYRAARDSADREGPTVTPDQRRADAFIALVSAAAGGHASARGREAARIVVVMSEKDLKDRARMTDVLESGTRLSAETLRRIACDSEFTPVIVGDRYEVLDVGRLHRLATPAIRVAVGLRDGGCAFPGCDVVMGRCDLHHVLPWQEGGPTSMANLVALCATHHALCEPVPEPQTGWPPGQDPPDRWEVRMDSDGLPEFLPPVRVDASRRPIRTDGHLGSLLRDTG